MRKLLQLVLTATVLFATLAMLAPTPGQAAGSAQPLAQAGLPPIPAGLPNHFGFGLFNQDTGDLPTGVTLDYRYQYLCCGVNTGSGWSKWNSPDGEYARMYLRDTRALGMIPVFIYYNILQSAPNYYEFTNLQNTGTMHAYFDDFKLLMTIAAADGGTILVDVEPDLSGVMQQNSTNTADDASLQPVAVASSGQSDVAGIPNTFRGFYQALAHIRDLYAPNVLLGIDISDWGAGDDVNLALHSNPNYDWAAHADRTAKYLNSFGPGYQLVFYDPSDRDSGYYKAVRGQDRWWDDTNTSGATFNTMKSWLGRIASQMNKRMLWWQVPNGNRVYRTVNNTANHWQDNRPEYFLNPTTGRQHIQDFAAMGLLGIMFGAGQGDQTYYADAAGDGITNPAPINGNTAVSTYPDDDGGYIRLGVDAYYDAGPLALPGSGPTATATKTATRTVTRTATKTATITRTPTRTATRTITKTPTRTTTPPTATRTPTKTATRTITRTPTKTATATKTPTRTRTATVTRTRTRTATRTATPLGTPAPRVAGVYTDALVNGWQDWSWDSSVNLSDPAYKQSGAYSAGVSYNAAWAGLFFGHNGFLTTNYKYLKFSINGGAVAGRTIQVALMDKASGDFIVKLNLNSYIAGGSVAANTWRAVSIPLTALQATNKTIMGLALQEASGNTQPRFYIDNVQFSSVP